MNHRERERGREREKERKKERKKERDVTTALLPHGGISK